MIPGFDQMFKAFRILNASEELTGIDFLEQVKGPKGEDLVKVAYTFSKREEVR
jgi:hypothetical protein